MKHLRAIAARLAARRRSILTTICELSGFGLIVNAGFLVAEPLGWTLAGAALIAVGYATDGKA